MSLAQHLRSNTAQLRVCTLYNLYIIRGSVFENTYFFFLELTAYRTRTSVPCQNLSVAVTYV